MALRIALVTPFSWSQPHDVNEHVAGIAVELRMLGHSVTVLTPSGRARDLAAGRRSLSNGLDAEIIALGPAVPISRRSRIGVPVGARFFFQAEDGIRGGRVTGVQTCALP